MKSLELGGPVTISGPPGYRDNADPYAQTGQVELCEMMGTPGKENCITHSLRADKRNRPHQR